MKNKIIIFTNIKGGVGKTTLCGLFATFCAERGIPVVVLDADLQQSLMRHRNREKESTGKEKRERNSPRHAPFQEQRLLKRGSDGLKSSVTFWTVTMMMKR